MAKVGVRKNLKFGGKVAERGLLVFPMQLNETATTRTAPGWQGV